MDGSVFELFRSGPGPAGSHSVGPMIAAQRFLLECGSLERAAGIEAALDGALAPAARSVMLGLMGQTESVDPALAEASVAHAEHAGLIRLLGQHMVAFSATRRPEQPTGLRFTLLLKDGGFIERTFFSCRPAFP